MKIEEIGSGMIVKLESVSNRKLNTIAIPTNNGLVLYTYDDGFTYVIPLNEFIDILSIADNKWFILEVYSINKDYGKNPMLLCNRDKLFDRNKETMELTIEQIEEIVKCKVNIVK